MVSFENSFASHEKAKNWSIKNIDKPEDVPLQSNKKYIFNCDKCNHEFEKRLQTITQTGSFCSYCTNRAICQKENCEKCLKLTFASHEKSKYWSKKNELKPYQVFKSSNKKFLFDCDKCFHTFDIELSNLVVGNWCSFCCNQKICKSLNCEKCKKLSFYDNPKAKFWSIQNKLKPIEVFNSSGNKYFFDCNICNHSFDMTLNNVNAGKWCPYCSNNKLCDNSDKINCLKCFNKSFASNEKSKFISNLNSILPTTIFLQSEKKLFFECNKCNHTFETSPAIIKMGCWCPYCTNQKLCGNNNCIMCFNKSLASHEKSKFFSVKNKIQPINIFLGSNKKYIFDCPDCKNEYEIFPNQIKNGSGCVNCRNKTEKILLNFLKSTYKKVTFQFKNNWCMNSYTNKLLPYDFLLDDCKIIIELDGRQHFIQVSNWDSPENTQKNDFHKINCANNNGYSIIRIYQEDVFYNKFNWQNVLIKSINEIICKNKITIKYLCSNNQYDEFINNYTIHQK
jgi:very-short-patch-repair endonuclease